MESQVAHPELAEAFDAVHAGLDAVFAAGLEPADARDAITVIQELERLGRRIDAARSHLVNTIDRRGLHRFDRHFSAKVMVRHVAALSNAEAARRGEISGALDHLDLLALRWREGQVGTPQVARIARVHANLRVRQALLAAQELFVQQAQALPYREFDAWVTGWVMRHDHDGTCDQSQRTHETRNATMVQDYDRGWELKANGGELAGLQMHDILRHFIDAEFTTDWAKAVAEHGAAATTQHLARTDAQRRFDALLEIFLRAAATPPGGQRPYVVTNIVMDWQTYQRELALLADDTPGAPDPAPHHTFRSAGIDGQPVSPTEAIAASLLGHVRRVVVGARSVVIDQGRRQRLFRGPAALAVRLGSTTCYWPGCHVPVSQCQLDHLTPYGDRPGGAGGGSTSPHNGGPACGRHNRAKEAGFAAWRDHDGTWHVTRPDGTEIP